MNRVVLVLILLPCMSRTPHFPTTLLRGWKTHRIFLHYRHLHMGRISIPTGFSLPIWMSGLKKLFRLVLLTNLYTGLEYRMTLLSIAFVASIHTAKPSFLTPLSNYRQEYMLSAETRAPPSAPMHPYIPHVHRCLSQTRSLDFPSTIVVGTKPREHTSNDILNLRGTDALATF
ncbi:hypothetical protein F5X96DRAFT_161744 [Biscogniauxia mediterranea]|nr:hypothetical protein F5X96DRAFT_161744 [Biscogniauxia mediterranea]